MILGGCAEGLGKTPANRRKNNSFALYYRYRMRYHIAMSRDDKIIRKMKESPRNVRFEELDGFLKRQGFEVQPRKRGSHNTYRRTDGLKITVARPHGGKKTVNINTVQEVIDKLEL
jgi:predicted RNA binding protein YcfA (HicA-like mRNA interferase family)